MTKCLVHSIQEWEEKIKPALDAAIIEKVFWKVSCRDNSTYLVMASSYEEAAKRVIETKTVAFTDKGMGANCGSHWRFITSIQQLDYQIL